MPLSDFAYELRPAAGEPAGALVLMHGRGADERDLLSLLDVFDPERRLVGICPRGPLSLPPGGQHWYAVRQVGFPDMETFQDTTSQLSPWLDALGQEIGVPIDKTILGGFSQGAVMSWAMAMGPGRPLPAGVLALSGFVPEVIGYELAGNLSGLPVAIAHGSFDQVIPVEFGRAARDQAQAAGADVTYLETRAPHTIDPSVMPELVAWVQARANAA